jgi:lambda family phage portal protein
VPDFSTANMLDRVILSINPVAGLTRIQAKTRAGILMNYDAASNGRRLKSWKSPGTDADAASAPGRARMRNRSRDMVRNAPFATRAQSVITNNVVGIGIVPSLSGGAKAAQKKAAEVVLPYLASADLDKHRVLNFSGMQTVVCNSVFEAGEVLAVRRTSSAAQGRALPFTVEILEIDHLNTALSSVGGNEVIEGIEYDAEGVAVAYHLYEKHPGGMTRLRDLKSNRVPAAEVLHIRRIDRPGQMRGVPWLAPVMLTLGELRDYQEAQILKQKIAALLVGIIETDDPIPEGSSGLEAMAPGGLSYLKPGEKVSFTDPPQVNDYDAVMRLGLAAVAMGIGITAESLTGDLSRVNFSSGRMGRLEMDKNIETWQAQILIAQFCAGVGKWALDAYRLMQPGAPARGLALAYTAPRRALIDPTKEIPAIIKKIDAGLSSLSREQRAMGLDPDVIAQERREDAARNPAPDPGEDPGTTENPSKGKAKT